MIVRNIVRRNPPCEIPTDSDLSSLPKKLQTILMNRGVHSAQDLDYGLSGLIPPSELLNVDKAAGLLFEFIQKQASILIIGDFDADGATSSALMIKGLRMLGADNVDFLVPDRFKFGYGLSEKLVEHAALQSPDLIITVDNGIANHQGVDRANELGIPVIITDHHLAAETLPAARVIVNPNQPSDNFASKNLAGVGVAFYLLMALRGIMRSNQWFEQQNMSEPNLAVLLDLVALGTVADVVVLDKNNRILVEQGLKRIRAGKACFGINALLDVSLRKIDQCRASDLGFALGPRLNAAGRLEDMSIGINCLLATSAQEAKSIASRLNTLNKQRRSIEQDMLEQANEDLAAYFSQNKELASLDNDSTATAEQRPTTLCLYDPKWHQGVIGILASRVKEKINRPVIVFAKEDGGENIKGSARSVAGVHIRDLLALVDAKHPGVILKFGGHAMAAGLSIKESDFQFFSDKLHQYADQLLADNAISDYIITDGPLSKNELSLSFAHSLRNIGPWGQGFIEPIFDDVFTVINKRIVGEKHLKLVLQKKEIMIDAINFFFDETLDIESGDKVEIIYKLDVNEFRGNSTVQLIVEQLKKI